MITQQHVAFVFPGQGSQYVGMLQELINNYTLAKQTFDEASAVLGYDMLTLATQGPEEKLNQTEYTQPALLTAGVAVYRVFQQLNNYLKPQIMAGHSLGEYTALVCANSLSFSDALQLVADRGKFMQAAVSKGEGAMAAIIGLELFQVTTLCEEAAQGDIVAPANINAIGQIVISGHKIAVERAITLAKTMGAKLAKLIPVSVPSHCDLMRPAAEKLLPHLRASKINVPDVVLIHNADVAAHNQPEQICKALVEQLYSPVRWVEIIQLFARNGITHVIELGPGKVLTGLNKRIDNTIETLSVYDEATLQQALLILRHTNSFDNRIEQ